MVKWELLEYPTVSNNISTNEKAIMNRGEDKTHVFLELKQLRYIGNQ